MVANVAYCCSCCFQMLMLFVSHEFVCVFFLHFIFDLTSSSNPQLL